MMMHRFRSLRTVHAALGDTYTFVTEAVAAAVRAMRGDRHALAGWRNGRRAHRWMRQQERDEAL